MAQHISQHRVFRPGAGFVALASLAAVLLVSAAPARGQHPRRNDQFKHQVEQLEQAWRSAELSGDVDAMGKLLSDDFVGINMSGQVVTKMQLLDRMRRRRTVLTQARSGRHEGEADWADRDRHLAGQRRGHERRRGDAWEVSLHQGLFAGGLGGVADHELRGDEGRACSSAAGEASQRGWSSCSGCSGCEAGVRRRDGRSRPGSGPQRLKPQILRCCAYGRLTAKQNKGMNPCAGSNQRTSYKYGDGSRWPETSHRVDDDAGLAAAE